MSSFYLKFPHWPEKHAKLHVFGASEADFCSIIENSPPPPRRDLVRKLWRSCRDSGGRTDWISDFGRKIRLNFGEDLFFLRSPVFERKKRFNFRFRPKNPSQFRISCLTLSKKAPPFSKSWLRAWFMMSNQEAKTPLCCRGKTFAKDGSNIPHSSHLTQDIAQLTIKLTKCTFFRC